jgi:hypothetical protein
MKKITVTLSDEAEAYFNEILYSLPKPGTEGDLCTQSDAINYALLSLQEFEKMFEDDFIIENPEKPI